MNTNLFASLLLPATLSATLIAQDLKLEAVVGPRALSASIRGAEDGAFVVLVLGLAEAATKLPDGQILGVSPDLLVGFAISHGGPTALYTRLGMELDAYDFFAQAVAISPRVPMGERGSLAVSNVQHVTTAIPPSGRPNNGG